MRFVPTLLSNRGYLHFMPQNFLYKSGDEGTITSPNYPEETREEPSLVQIIKKKYC